MLNRVRCVLGFLALSGLLSGCKPAGGPDTTQVIIPDRPQVILPRDGVFHSVQQGETLRSISAAYGKSEESVRAVNGLSRLESVVPGQKLFIPGATKAVQSQGAPVSVGVIPPVSPYRGPRVERLLKPVPGKVLIKYGQPIGGVPSNGVILSAAEGEGVWAAQDGVVRFVGDQYPGLGNVVLLQHSGGRWSLYGNLSGSLVKVGQNVKQGEVIARAGQTGRALQPQVHFRLYRNGEALDPMPQFVE